MVSAAPLANTEDPPPPLTFKNGDALIKPGVLQPEILRCHRDQIFGQTLPKGPDVKWQNDITFKGVKKKGKKQ